MPVRDIKIGHSVGYRALHRGSQNSHHLQNSSNSTRNANLPDPFPSAPPPVNTLSRPPRYTPIPPARYDAMPLFSGKVKSALSGDTLILTSPNHPERERALSLAYCTAPRIKKEGDELGAFESRDTLRRLLVGKNVHFKVLYTTPNTQREYGIVMLGENGPRFPEYMVEQGWIKLREDAGRKEDTEEALQQISQLRVLEATARSENKGLWSPDLTHIDVHNDMGDPQKFLDTWKGKPIDAIVERVLSGDRLLVRLFATPNTHFQCKSRPSQHILACNQLHPHSCITDPGGFK